MTLWLGWPGMLWALPDPAPGVGASLERSAGEHRTIGGGRTVEFTGTGRRSFHLVWERLTDDEYAVLETIFTGAAGIGPWMLATDDARWNYLTSGQASAAAVVDTIGWSATGGENLSVVYNPAGGPPSARGAVVGWSLPVPVTSGRLAALAPAHLGGWPAPPGRPWTFTTLAATTAAAPVVGMVLRWFDTTDTELTPTTGAGITLGTDRWATLTITATPPPDAVRMMPEVHLVPGSVTGPVTVYLDAPRLMLTPTDRGWLPGRGLPLVSMTSLTDRYPWADTHDAEATLVEVG